MSFDDDFDNLQLFDALKTKQIFDIMNSPQFDKAENEMRIKLKNSSILEKITTST